MSRNSLLDHIEAIEEDPAMYPLGVKICSLSQLINVFFSKMATIDSSDSLPFMIVSQEKNYLIFCFSKAYHSSKEI